MKQFRLHMGDAAPSRCATDGGDAAARCRWWSDDFAQRSSPLLAHDSIRVGHHRSGGFCWTKSSLHTSSFDGTSFNTVRVVHIFVKIKLQYGDFRDGTKANNVISLELGICVFCSPVIASSLSHGHHLRRLSFTRTRLLFGLSRRHWMQ